MPTRICIGPLLKAGFLLQLLPLLALADPAPTARHIPTAYIAIIIDDMGHSRQRGMAAIDLPAPLTYAIIPDTRHSTRLARYAHDIGKEVMIHLPMANTRSQPMSNIALTGELDHAAYSEVIDRALARVPFAKGLNNHMGSQLTQEPRAMGQLMKSMQEHGMFFVDSRTTPKTIAKTIAAQHNLKSASRDVFLDNSRTLHDIDRQFRKLLELARTRRTAIAIGHPYPETLDYLALALPKLKAENIRIIPVSDMIRMRQAFEQLASAT